MTKKQNSNLTQELEKLDQKFQDFDSQVKDLTLDNMNLAPKLESESQTKISQKDLEKSKDIYLKPSRTLGPGINPKTGEKEKFNEKFRCEYEYDKEYVQFIAENNELIGCNIEIWSKPYPGINTEYWEVPTNKPVWGPRYLAEQIKRKTYHKLSMENRPTSEDKDGQYYGTMVAKNTVQRLDARPVSSGRSIFTGSSSF